MTRLRRPAAAALLAAMLVAPLPAAAFDPEVLESVVSVLPVWPGHPQGGQPDLPPGLAPEGTAVAIAPGGYLATALHVVDRALSITVRLADGSSEERRVGKECGRTCRSRWSPYY